MKQQQLENRLDKAADILRAAQENLNNNKLDEADNLISRARLVLRGVYD